MQPSRNSRNCASFRKRKRISPASFARKSASRRHPVPKAARSSAHGTPCGQLSYPKPFEQQRFHFRGNACPSAPFVVRLCPGQADHFGQQHLRDADASTRDVPQCLRPFCVRSIVRCVPRARAEIARHALNAAVTAGELLSILREPCADGHLVLFSISQMAFKIIFLRYACLLSPQCNSYCTACFSRRFSLKPEPADHRDA